MASHKRRGGAHFDWHPKDYANVVQILSAPPPLLKSAILHAISFFGSLSCPAPATDPNTVYRVFTENNEPIVQKNTGANDWQKCWP